MRSYKKRVDVSRERHEEWNSNTFFLNNVPNDKPMEIFTVSIWEIHNILASEL